MAVSTSVLDASVASRVEAWIETLTQGFERPNFAVASRVEAWIETLPRKTKRERFTSPPAWRRGLKQSSYTLIITNNVASRVEAWIET